MSSYVFSEPRPTVPASGLTHSGRGGAGNIRLSSPSTTTAAHPIKVPRATGRFYTGIGGAGNAHPASQRQEVSFTEDFERARSRDAVPTGHVGVGGAGNVFRRSIDSSETEDNEERRSSVSSGFWGRLSMGSLSRH